MKAQVLISNGVLSLFEFSWKWEMLASKPVNHTVSWPKHKY